MLEVLYLDARALSVFVGSEEARGDQFFDCRKHVGTLEVWAGKYYLIADYSAVEARQMARKSMRFAFILSLPILGDLLDVTSGFLYSLN